MSGYFADLLPEDPPELVELDPLALDEDPPLLGVELEDELLVLDELLLLLVDAVDELPLSLFAALL